MMTHVLTQVISEMWEHNGYDTTGTDNQTGCKQIPKTKKITEVVINGSIL